MPNGVFSGLVKRIGLCQSGTMHDTLPADAILFKDHTAAELHAVLADLGVTPRLARRLQAAVLQRGAAETPAALPEMSPRCWSACAR